MKTKLFIRICGWIVAAVLTCGLSASCNLAKILGDVEDIVDGDGEVYGWSESGNKMTFTANFVVYTLTMEWTFGSDDKCTSAKSSVKWSSAELANAYWDELTADEKEKVTRNGNTVTEDLTEEYLGVDKATIRETFEYLGE